MKRCVFSLLLAAALLLGLASTAFATAPWIVYPVKGGNLYFDKATQSIERADSTVSESVLPAVIDGTPVRRIGYSAFGGNRALTSVTLPEGLTVIDDQAFTFCSQLSTVILPESLERIGMYAFSDNVSLHRIVFKSALQSIDGYAFENCTNLTTACFTGDLPTLGKEVFWRNGLNSITNSEEHYPLPRLTLYYLPDRAGWAGLTGYVTSPWDGNAIPTGLVKKPIDGGTLSFSMETGEITSFSGTLTRLELPEKINGSTVRRVAAGAFAGQTALTTVTLPDTLFYLGNGAFKDCTALQTVRMPRRMLGLGTSLFENCTSLQSLTLPAGLRDLPWRLAFNCSALTYVGFSEGITDIRGEAFSGCRQLSRLALPESLRSIGADAFAYCRSIELLVLPTQLKTMNDWCFIGCTGLKTITVPASMQNLGYLPFQDCKALREVYFLGDAPLGGAGAFDNCPDVTVFYPPDAEGWSTPEWNGYPAYPASHTHRFVSQVTAPTCTEAGYTLQRCSCGEARRVDPVAPLGHDYQNGICARCGRRDPNAAQQPLPVYFRDVSAKAWYAEAVTYAVRAGLMNGVGGECFDPEGSMTRAMLVTVLWRNAGSPEGYENRFRDVPAGQWYTEAVAWAAGNGVVNGVGDGLFDPESAVTREQIATILFRYDRPSGTDSEARDALRGFPDAAEVSDWAAEALSWAVTSGIIGGSADHGQLYLLPQTTATRSQVAAILMRYLEQR